MIASIRQTFNQNFTQEVYQKYLRSEEHTSELQSH